MLELQRMTLVEYNLRMKVYALKQADVRFNFIQNEFLKRSIEATETKGDKTYYIHKSPEEIMDIESIERKILYGDVIDDKFNDLVKIAKRVKERKELK